MEYFSIRKLKEIWQIISNLKVYVVDMSVHDTIFCLLFHMFEISNNKKLSKDVWQMKHLAVCVCCWFVFEMSGKETGSYWLEWRDCSIGEVCFEVLNHKVGKWPTGQLARMQITECDTKSEDFFLNSILPRGFEFCLMRGPTVLDSPLSCGAVIQIDLLWSWVSAKTQ